MVFILVCVLALTAILVACCAALYALATSRKAHMSAQQMQLQTEQYNRMIEGWRNSVTECAKLDMAVRQVELRQGKRSRTGTRLGYAPRSN
jgi:predicted Holliday junction resolvase-like endonuclease